MRLRPAPKWVVADLLFDDYVFDGTKASAYVETDLPILRPVYGRSKLAGEEAILESLDQFAILRIAWGLRTARQELC